MLSKVYSAAGNDIRHFFRIVPIIFVAIHLLAADGPNDSPVAQKPSQSALVTISSQETNLQPKKADLTIESNRISQSAASNNVSSERDPRNFLGHKCFFKSNQGGFTK